MSGINLLKCCCFSDPDGGTIPTLVYVTRSMEIYPYPVPPNPCCQAYFCSPWSGGDGTHRADPDGKHIIAAAASWNSMYTVPGCGYPNCQYDPRYYQKTEGIEVFATYTFHNLGYYPGWQEHLRVRVEWQDCLLTSAQHASAGGDWHHWDFDYLPGYPGEFTNFNVDFEFLTAGWYSVNPTIGRPFPTLPALFTNRSEGICTSQISGGSRLFPYSDWWYGTPEAYPRFAIHGRIINWQEKHFYDPYLTDVWRDRWHPALNWPITARWLWK